MRQTQKRPVAYETRAAVSVETSRVIQDAVDELPVALRHDVTVPLPIGDLAGWDVSSLVGQGQLIFEGSYAVATDVATGATSGTAGAGTTATSLVKPTAAANWTANDLRGKLVRITSGGGAGEVRPILSNTTTAAEVDTIVGLDTTSVFQICHPQTQNISEISIEGCICPVVFRGMKFGHELQTSENRKIILDGCELSGADWYSNYDGRVILRNCLVSGGYALLSRGIYRAAEVENCFLSNGRVQVDDSPYVSVRAVARDCAGNAVHLSNVTHARIDVLANSNSVTPFYFEAVHYLDAIGTNKLTGSGNTGYGISINTAGRYRLVGCNVTGSSGDIDFDGEPLLWSNLGSSTYGVASKFGATLIGETSENKCIEYKSKTFLETVEVSGRLLTYGFHNMSQVTGLTATGSTASDALQLTQFVYNRVDTVASGTGVKMTNGALIPGVLAIIHNNGANTLTVYPYTGGTINGGASTTVVAGARIMMVSSSGDGLSWVTV